MLIPLTLLLPLYPDPCLFSMLLGFDLDLKMELQALDLGQGWFILIQSMNQLKLLLLALNLFPFCHISSSRFNSIARIPSSPISNFLI